MEGMLRSRRLADRLAVAAAIALVGAVAADALRHRHRAAPPTAAAPAAKPLLAAPVPARIRLVPSSTAFLPRCAPARTSLALAAGPRLVLRYEGPPCHLPPLRLRAVVRSGGGGVLYRGRAVAADALAGNYAADSHADAPLLGAAARCGARVAIAGGGLDVRGRIRCR
jgi:hypothetical protein